jgi:F-type H+-transporting ATPase subunit b
MELLKLIDSNLVLAQIVCFLLVLWLLKKFLWKPVFTVLEERRARIASELKVIEDTKAEALRLRGEYETMLGKIDELTSKRLKEIEAVGEARAQQIREHGREEAERIVEDARKELQFEFIKSKDVLKGELVEMVIAMTEKMIQEKLSFSTDKKLVEGFLKDLEKVDAK